MYEWITALVEASLTASSMSASASCVAPASRAMPYDFRGRATPTASAVAGYVVCGVGARATGRRLKDRIALDTRLTSAAARQIGHHYRAPRWASINAIPAQRIGSSRTVARSSRAVSFDRPDDGGRLLRDAAFGATSRRIIADIDSPALLQIRPEQCEPTGA